MLSTALDACDVGAQIAFGKFAQPHEHLGHPRQRLARHLVALLRRRRERSS